MSGRSGKGGKGRQVLGGAAVEGLGKGAFEELLPPRGREGRLESRDAPATNQAPEAEVGPAAPRRPAKSQPGRAKAAAPTRARLTADLPAETVERAKNCVYWTPGLTLVALLDAALTWEISRREADRGEVFPVRTGELPTGRPILGLSQASVDQ